MDAENPTSRRRSLGKNAGVRSAPGQTAAVRALVASQIEFEFPAQQRKEMDARGLRGEAVDWLESRVGDLRTDYGIKFSEDDLRRDLRSRGFEPKAIDTFV